MRKLNILITITFCILFAYRSYSYNSYVSEQEFVRDDNLSSKDSVNGNNIEDQNMSKGMFRFIVSFPYINSFYLQPKNENSKNNTGFMRVTFSLDYFYKTNRHINLSFSQIVDFFSPLPFRDYWKVYEVMDSYYISLSNNHKVNRFSFGYGFSFAQNNWELINNGWDESSTTREPVKKTNYAFGLVSSSYFQLTPTFHLGIVYRPTFLRSDIEPTFKYEHTISIDIGWKIPIGK
ncbi:MAG: hypothetical protein U9R19_10045 [Bacteroidota bacterium]|nr:hypothetical protein [Bacteroidota bacterium]